MRMPAPRLFLAAASLALLLAAGAVACTETDDPLAGAPADGGAPPSNEPPATPPAGSDAGRPDAVPDASDGPAALAPIATVKLPNTVNPYGVVWASDGLLYVSGARIDTANANDRVLAVWRFSANGQLDATFGTGGVVTLPMAGDESSFDIVEVSAGSFVVHATAGGKVWLVSLSKDGGGTYAFGTPKPVLFGWQDADFGAWPLAPATPQYTSWGIGVDRSVAGAPKIAVFAHGAPAKVATGPQRTDNDRWIARVLADADFTPDPAFNGGQAFSLDANGAGLADNARRGMVHPDGTIVSAGYADFGPGANGSVVLVRLTPAGALDQTFGFGAATLGQTKFNPFLANTSSGFAEAYAVARQSSGRYVTTGYGVSGFEATTVQNDLVTFGVNADGLDPTYGKLGAFAIQSETDPTAGLGKSAFRENGRDLVVLSDDRTVQVGCYDDFASVFVLTKDGKLDTSFGAGGVLEYGYGFPFFKVALSPDGKRIAATAQSGVVAPATEPSSLLAILEVRQ